MRVYTTIYLVEDGFGNMAFAASEDSCDVIQISGLRNNSDEIQYFESEAYHLGSWCEVNGFKYKVIRKEYDFAKLWNEN